MKSALNLLIIIALEIRITNYIFNMFEQKAKKCTLSRRSAPVLNNKLSPLTKCCTNDNNYKRLLDNESFFLQNKFYYDQYRNRLPVCP